MPKFSDLGTELEKILEQSCGLKSPLVAEYISHWQPFADVYETEEAIVAKIELAGVRREDIQLTLDRNKLILEGVRKEISSEKKKCYYQMEINYGTFERVISLSQPVKSDQIKVNFEGGILEVVLPKASERRSSYIVLKIG
ncbi:MAG: Hsp20/alpha crystallin family protein [bacterium]|nr:Hsp20/alpha crystallin family protein [bacterium]